MKGTTAMPYDEESLAELKGEDFFVHIPVGEAKIEGNLVIPKPCHGVILFAHGSGSSRHSPRNKFVAQQLHRGGFGTLLLDLLTRQEEDWDNSTGDLRFDIGFLAERLIAAIDWYFQQRALLRLPLGLFGASTGAAAAIVAAAKDKRVRAVVSRGGRPDLAFGQLERVRAPTLLIVGDQDYGVIELNQQALALLKCEKEMVLIPGATHLFEEPGKLQTVAELAMDWFTQHLILSTRTSQRSVSGA
jgi:putative phosphoribosyl transferase